MNKSNQKIIMEESILRAVYAMGLESLGPEGMDMLDEVFKRIAETRGISFPIILTA